MKFIIAFLIICNAAHATDYQKILDACCYIYVKSAGNARGGGSGCVIGEDYTKVFILTAGHLIKRKDNTGWVYFTHGGRWRGKMAFKVEKTTRTKLIDIAVISVKKTEFTRTGVKIPAPLEIANTPIGMNKTIISAGHPDAGWQTLFIGRTLSYKKGNMIAFRPVIKKGRSGSPLINKNTEIVGVVVQMTSANSYATDLKTIKEFLK